MSKLTSGKPDFSDTFHIVPEELSALPRELSRTQTGNSLLLVAEYQTKMIPKQLLRAKLHEWNELLEAQGVQEEDFS
ncbi:MAG: hypothetical protein K1Y36_30850 [Blastocatellia bacterium]|nr:hypothetical protein [Blastocatellia bacterium]